MPDPNLSSFIWSVADLLRGDYKQSEYGKVILPFTVLRRLDCVLEPTKAAVLAELATRKKSGVNPEPFLLRKSGQLFYNTSPLDMKKLMGDQDHIGENLRAYMQAFSPAVRDIFESFEFHLQIDRLAKAKLLYLVTEKFANIDLHPDAVSNAQMGAVFEELIRKFAELSNETAGEHFTPREVIRLMVNASARGLPTLDLGRGRGHDLWTFENFAFTTIVTSQADGTWRVMVTGAVDPRIQVVRIGPLRIDKITDQDGRSLLTAVAGGLTSGTAHQAGWSSIATVQSVAGVQSVKELRGSVTVSVLEKEEIAVFDLTRQWAPVKTPQGVMSVEQAGGAGGNLRLHLDPSEGAVPAVVAPAAPPFVILTIRSFDDQNKLLGTNFTSTAFRPATVGLPGGATRVEVSWASRTRDVVIPVEGEDLPVPPPVPVPAPVPAGPMPVDGIRR